MDLEGLSGIFSNRTGVQQSIASSSMGTVMSYALQNLMQRGIGSFLNSGGSDKSGMKNALSKLQGDASNPDHDLVQQVKNNSGISDNGQAQQYTQQALSMLQEHTEDNPGQVRSALESHASQKGFDLGSLLRGLP